MKSLLESSVIKNTEELYPGVIFRYLDSYMPGESRKHIVRKNNKIINSAMSSGVISFASESTSGRGYRIEFLGFEEPTDDELETTQRFILAQNFGN